MRYMVVGVAVVLGLAGCAAPENGGREPEAAPSVSLPADPKAALAVGAGKLGTQSARVTFRIGTGEWMRDGDLTGVTDETGRTYELTGPGYVIRRIGDDAWLKLTTMPKDEDFDEQDLNKWVRQTAADLEDTITLGSGFPWKLPQGTVNQGSGITRAAERSYRGTLIRKPKAKDGHFAAELDHAGRFTRVTSGVGESFDNLYVLEFSGYGVPVKLETPPSGDVIDRPLVSLETVWLR
ncbi:hypothetical protein [Paractinoplanes atraurantiacus]|uniref:Lipoprotein LprG n=1 Tax=Paractinoplanes atraurantiacus TaxID=1036182 RepID=A0A285J3A9_9ACTN|nr:hypothetical protein [Actinoplanes atraurantiacus]SNY54754.1 hypothetical protein SAMN05421748_115149 [Actinoplanes atraurantiacus]